MVRLYSITSRLFFFLIVSSGMAQDEEVLKNYTYQDLESCSLSSFEIAGLGPNDDLEPCIIFDMKPSQSQTTNGTKTSVIPIVQVTPHHCNNHRDGVVAGVQFVNEDNEGRGFAIGYSDVIEEEETQTSRDRYYVQFHLVSVIAGNPGALSEEEYDRRHAQLLKSMITTLDAPYIVGTCSFASSIEKQVAEDHKAILMAQVGPPGYYEEKNPYVFGFHINSDLYPLPNVQSLIFLADQQKRNGLATDIPVRFIYRTKSEFFYRYVQQQDAL
jgi:hypothetical protein